MLLVPLALFLVERTESLWLLKGMPRHTCLSVLGFSECFYTAWPIGTAQRIVPSSLSVLSSIQRRHQGAAVRVGKRRHQRQVQAYISLL